MEFDDLQKNKNPWLDIGAVKVILAYLLVVGLVLAIAPTISKQSEFRGGGQSLLYGLSADCNKATINLSIINESFSPVKDAVAQLSYSEGKVLPLASQTTDQKGFTQFQLPGKTTFMRGAFELTIIKPGFKTRVISFYLAACYTNWTDVNPPWNPTKVVKPKIEENKTTIVKSKPNVTVIKIGDKSYIYTDGHKPTEKVLAEARTNTSQDALQKITDAPGNVIDSVKAAICGLKLSFLQCS